MVEADFPVDHPMPHPLAHHPMLGVERLPRYPEMVDLELGEERLPFDPLHRVQARREEAARRSEEMRKIAAQREAARREEAIRAQAHWHIFRQDEAAGQAMGRNRIFDVDDLQDSREAGGGSVGRPRCDSTFSSVDWKSLRSPEPTSASDNYCGSPWADFIAEADLLEALLEVLPLLVKRVLACTCCRLRTTIGMHLAQGTLSVRAEDATFSNAAFLARLPTLNALRVEGENALPNNTLDVAHLRTLERITVAKLGLPGAVFVGALLATGNRLIRMTTGATVALGPLRERDRLQLVAGLSESDYAALLGALSLNAHQQGIILPFVTRNGLFRMNMSRRFIAVVKQALDMPRGNYEPRVLDELIAANEMKRLAQQVRQLSDEQGKPAALAGFQPMWDNKAEAEATASHDGTCVICLTDKATHVMVPCGHSGLCASCADELEHPRLGKGKGRAKAASLKCPVCYDPMSLSTCIVVKEAPKAAVASTHSSGKRRAAVQSGPSLTPGERVRK